MPRKTKALIIEENENEKLKKEKNGKTVTVAKAPAKTATTSKKTSSTTSSKKKKMAASSVKEEKIVKKQSSTKKSKVTTSKTVAEKKPVKSKAEKTSTKKANGKKETTVKTVTKKSTANSKKKTTKKKEIQKQDFSNINEYYDLPYRYNDTIVRVLAQTPKILFVYWDISDQDRENYKKIYGEQFFYNTYPVLIVHNITMNYTFEVPIDDFASNWYLPIQDEKCNYSIELGRRAKNIMEYSIPNNYISITTSNEIESPNGHILLDQLNETLYFRNVKTKQVISKNIANLSFMKNAGRIYDIYKKMYHDMELDDYLNNPSSGNPTSTFK